jgi:hypothetical protein
MTIPRSRILTGVAAGILVAGSLGCGAIRSVKNIADNAATLGELSDKLNNAEKLTYQAQYKLHDGSTVTVAQQPPRAAAIGATGRYLATADAYLWCATDNGKTDCERTPRDAADPSGDAAVMAGIGAGFVSAPLALAVLTTAILVPSAKVEKSDKTIAGQKSTCATVSNLESAQQDEPASQRLHGFTVCITDDGVLARFTGTSSDGKPQGVELTSYSTKVDSSLFQLPAGARVTDLGAVPADSPSS